MPAVSAPFPTPSSCPIQYLRISSNHTLNGKTKKQTLNKEKRKASEMMKFATPGQEIHLRSKTATPFMSAPTSPCHYSTAGTSPATSVASAASCLSNLLIMEGEGDDFVFDFSGNLNKPAPELTTADELFYNGKIRPLKFPLRLCSMDIADKNSDPFAASMADPSRESRGRSRTPSLSSKSRKGSRSLSPLRGESNPNANPNSFPSNASIICSCKGEEANNSSKKWCFKDLLLFRSASEGRATGDRNKDPVRKYTAACSLPRGKKGSPCGDDSRCSSFRFPSPHAIHYETNRAAADVMKRKTALPFKDSFFGWFRLAPGLRAGGSAVFDHYSKNISGSKSLSRLR